MDCNHGACATCHYAPTENMGCAWPDWPCYHEFGYDNQWSCHYKEQRSMSDTLPCRRCEHLQGSGLLEECVCPGDDCKYDFLMPNGGYVPGLQSMFRPKGWLLDSYQSREARHKAFMLKLLHFMTEYSEPDWHGEYINNWSPVQEKVRFGVYLLAKANFGRYYRATQRWYKIMQGRGK